MRPVRQVRPARPARPLPGRPASSITSAVAALLLLPAALLLPVLLLAGPAAAREAVEGDAVVQAPGPAGQGPDPIDVAGAVLQPPVDRTPTPAPAQAEPRAPTPTPSPASAPTPAPGPAGTTPKPDRREPPPPPPPTQVPLPAPLPEPRRPTADGDDQDGGPIGDQDGEQDGDQTLTGPGGDQSVTEPDGPAGAFAEPPGPGEVLSRGVRATAVPDAASAPGAPPAQPGQPGQPALSPVAAGTDTHTGATPAWQNTVTPVPAPVPVPATPTPRPPDAGAPQPGDEAAGQLVNPQSVFYASLNVPTIAFFQARRLGLLGSVIYQPRSFALDVAEMELLSKYRFSDNGWIDAGAKSALYAGLVAVGQGLGHQTNKSFRLPTTPPRLLDSNWASEAPVTLAVNGAVMYTVGGPVKQALVDGGVLPRPSGYDEHGQPQFATNEEWLANILYDTANVAITNTVGFNVHEGLKRRAKVKAGTGTALSPAGLVKKLAIDLAISAGGYYISASSTNQPPEPGPLRDVAMAPANVAGEVERTRLEPATITDHYLSRKLNGLTRLGRLGWEGLWRNTYPGTHLERLFKAGDHDDDIHNLISAETWDAAAQDQARADSSWRQMVLGTAHSKLDHAIRWGANAYEYADTYQDELLANLWPAGPTGQEAQQQVQLRRARLGAQLRMEDDWRVLTGDADDGTSSAGTWDEGTASGGGGSGWS